MSSSYDIIKSLVITEKSSQMESLGKYLFWVDTRANKVQIRQSVEEIYQVKVKDVNTAVMPGKLRRVRHVAGKSPDWKKAIVTLEKGQRIEIK